MHVNVICDAMHAKSFIVIIINHFSMAFGRASARIEFSVRVLAKRQIPAKHLNRTENIEKSNGNGFYLYFIRSHSLSLSRTDAYCTHLSALSNSAFYAELFLLIFRCNLLSLSDSRDLTSLVSARALKLVYASMQCACVPLAQCIHVFLRAHLVLIHVICLLFSSHNTLSTQSVCDAQTALASERTRQTEKERRTETLRRTRIKYKIKTIYSPYILYALRSVYGANLKRRKRTTAMLSTATTTTTSKYEKKK